MNVRARTAPTRRRFLKTTAAGGAALALWRLDTVSAGGPPPQLWSDPATWGGRVPGRGDRPTIDRPVILDRDATVDGLEITESGALVFREDVGVTLTSTANIVNRGLLAVRQPDPALRHEIRFAGVDPNRFRGDSMDVVESDVGLWVLDAGVLDVAGAPKLAWTRAAGALKAGATRIDLQAEPVGWQVGDRVVITPSGSRHDEFDEAVISSVDAGGIELDRSLTKTHPAVNVGRGLVMTAEILNLDRNVTVRGTDGPSHIFVRSARPQSVAHALLENMGTWKMGRYALHFHHNMDGSRGSIVDGVVVHKARGRAFVPHMSHGITLRSCIAHDVKGQAFWWDTSAPGEDKDTSHDCRWESCVASRVRLGGYRHHAFQLGEGIGNQAIGCVAVGCEGKGSSAGFAWPEGHHGAWGFTGCVAHSNQNNGIFTWQNTGAKSVVENFVCYYNGRAGLEHGAYWNAYKYRDGIIFGSGRASIILHAASRPGDNMTFENLLLNGRGRAKHAIEVLKHTLGGTNPTLVRNVEMVRHTGAAIAFTYNQANGESRPERMDIVDCTHTGKLLWLHGKTLADSVIRVEDRVNGALEVYPKGAGKGSPWPEWNAEVYPIVPFAEATYGKGSASTAPDPSAPAEPTQPTGPAPTEPAPTATTAPATTAPPPSTTTTTRAPTTTTTTPKSPSPQGEAPAHYCPLPGTTTEPESSTVKGLSAEIIVPSRAGTVDVLMTNTSGRVQRIDLFVNGRADRTKRVRNGWRNIRVTTLNPVRTGHNVVSAFDERGHLLDCRSITI